MAEQMIYKSKLISTQSDIKLIRFFLHTSLKILAAPKHAMLVVMSLHHFRTCMG